MFAMPSRGYSLVHGQPPLEGEGCCGPGSSRYRCECGKGMNHSFANQFTLPLAKFRPVVHFAKVTFRGKIHHQSAERRRDDEWHEGSFEKQVHDGMLDGEIEVIHFDGLPRARRRERYEGMHEALSPAVPEPLGGLLPNIGMSSSLLIFQSETFSLKRTMRISPAVIAKLSPR